MAAEARPGLGLAAPPRPAAAGRHRAGRAAARRCRRDAAASPRPPRELVKRLARDKGRGRAQDRAQPRRAARRLHPLRRHGRRRRPPHPAEGRGDRRGGRLPAPALRAHPPRLHRGLPRHAERQACASASSRRGCASSASRGRRSRAISPPANGAARRAAMPSRGLPAPSPSSSSAPTPTWSGCRSTRPIALLDGEGYPVRFSWLNAA